jgi:hypothetical protein
LLACTVIWWRITRIRGAVRTWEIGIGLLVLTLSMLMLSNSPTSCQAES